MFFGRLHADEGAYLYAALAVYRGKLLYKDFFFLQPPVHPYFYGFFQMMFPGIVSGRLLSMVLGLAGLTLIIGSIRRLGYRIAPVLAICLTASTPFILYFLSITRLYSLAFFWLACGTTILIRSCPLRLANALLASLFFSLAVATRLTALPAIICFWFFLFWMAESSAVRYIPIILSGSFLVAIFGGFSYFVGPEQLYFNLLGMNLSLHKFNYLSSIVEKFRTTSQLIRYNFLLALMLIPLLMNSFRKIRFRLNFFTGLLRKPETFFWVMSISVFAGHTFAKMYQVSYQVFVLPFFIVACSMAWEKAIISYSGKLQTVFFLIFTTGCALSVLSFTPEFIDIVNGKSVITSLKEQADFLRSRCPENTKVFSADSTLAVIEADLDVLPGMAGSDLFPDWPTDKCLKFKVLNFEIMGDYIKKEEPCMVVIGDKSFTLSLPYLEPISSHLRTEFINLIETHYELAGTFPNLYIPGTKTYYYSRRTMR